MNATVDALVLRAVDYRESDKILTVLTREKGRLTVKAAGSRRKGSRLASCTQPYCYSEMVLFEKDGRYSLNEGSIKAQFYGLCADIEKAALAGYFASVLMAEPEETPGGEDVLRLVLNSFYALENNLCPQAVIKAAFELRYMAMCGYSPDFASCAKCGETGRGGYINVESGIFLCEKCHTAPSYGDRFLNQRAVEAAKYITTCDLKRIFSFKLPEKSLSLLADFCEEYLINKTEQSYRALDFYKSLF